MKFFFRFSTSLALSLALLWANLASANFEELFRMNFRGTGNYLSFVKEDSRLIAYFHTADGQISKLFSGKPVEVATYNQKIPADGSASNDLTSTVLFELKNYETTTLPHAEIDSPWKFVPIAVDGHAFLISETGLVTYIPSQRTGYDQDFVFGDGANNHFEVVHYKKNEEFYTLIISSNRKNNPQSNISLMRHSDKRFATAGTTISLEELAPKFQKRLSLVNSELSEKRPSENLSDGFFIVNDTFKIFTLSPKVEMADLRPSSFTFGSKNLADFTTNSIKQSETNSGLLLLEAPRLPALDPRPIPKEFPEAKNEFLQALRDLEDLSAKQGGNSDLSSALKNLTSFNAHLLIYCSADEKREYVKNLTTVLRGPIGNTEIGRIAIYRFISSLNPADFLDKQYLWELDREIMFDLLASQKMSSAYNELRRKDVSSELFLPSPKSSAQANDLRVFSKALFFGLEQNLNGVNPPRDLEELGTRAARNEHFMPYFTAVLKTALKRFPAHPAKFEGPEEFIAVTQLVTWARNADPNDKELIQLLRHYLKPTQNRDAGLVGEYREGLDNTTVGTLLRLEHSAPMAIGLVTGHGKVSLHELVGISNLFAGDSGVQAVVIKKFFELLHGSKKEASTEDATSMLKLLVTIHENLDQFHFASQLRTEINLQLGNLPDWFKMKIDKNTIERLNKPGLAKLFCKELF